MHAFKVHARTMEIYDFIFVAAWFMGGFVTGISGLGGAMIAVPILATFIPANVLFPVSCITTLVMCTYMAWIYRKDSIYAVVKRLSIGAIPGSIVGISLLLYIKAQYIQLLAGLVMLVFVYLQILRGRKQQVVQREETQAKSISVGFAAGVLISSITFGGPPLAAYSLYLGWSQAQAMGIMNVFSFLAFFVAAVFQASAGLYTAEVLNLAVIGSIATVVGGICATPLAKKVPIKTFRLLILIIIFCGGITCVWRGFGF